MRAEYAVAEFGRTLGMEDLSLHPMGQVRLGLPSGDWITLEEHLDDLVVSLVLHCPHVSASALLGALQLCDARQHRGQRSFQVGLLGMGQECAVVVATRMLADSASAQDIETAISDCTHWAHRWQSQSQVTMTGR